MDSDVRMIKKYPNRRLYDTEDSRYIKLQEIKKIIEQEVPIKVIDSKSKEDITRSIILQIILEQESNNDPLFSTENLIHLIHFNSETSRKGFMHFMDKNLNYFQEQQKLFKEHFKELAGFNPVDFWLISAQRNIESWKQIQDDLLSSAGLSRVNPTINKKQD